MPKFLVLLLALLIVPTAEAAELRLLMGSTISSFSNRWPSAYDNYAFDGSGLNPFKNYRAGVAFGLAVGFPLVRGISLEIGAQYSARGADYKMWYPSLGNDGYEEFHDLKGVSFPLIIRFSPLGRPWPYVLAGGDVTFILQHRRRTLILYNYGYDDQWHLSGGEDFDPSTRKWDFAPLVGLGVEVPISRGTFFIEGRYELGLTNLYRGSLDGLVRTRTVHVLVGYRIGAPQ